ncbi:MAG: MBL fold metallo-hydrolase [Gammaproteobacteria bacterium]|nr:MBL fold metallo-hydrolase [Gammaproteobacteria bacterium]
MQKYARAFRFAFLVTAAIALLSILVIAWLWQDRAAVEELDWPVAMSPTRTDDEVAVTWLGVTTLLFDDGETQILTDGFFSRPGLFEHLLIRPTQPDVATINLALAEYRVNRLAAIVPLHSHFDHAMDAGAVANRSTAVILGSESTANIARGARVPVEQYQILANRESRQFGNFTITLIHSRHAPIGTGGKAIYPGAITEPLVPPVRLSAYKEGVTYSVLIEHPRGRVLVQGSAGYRERSLRSREADVVILGVGGLQRLGRDHAEKYWQEIVVQSNASRVFPVHFDDFTKPFGELRLFPKVVDDVLQTARWFDDFAASGDQAIIVEQLPYGQPLILF